MEPNWYLLSVGPDHVVDSQIPQGVVIQYDPTNGMKSKGDIVFGRFLNPRHPGRGGSLPESLGRRKGNEESWYRTEKGYVYQD